jgi:hypothetical protein
MSLLIIQILQRQVQAIDLLPRLGRLLLRLPHALPRLSVLAAQLRQVRIQDFLLLRQRELLLEDLLFRSRGLGGIGAGGMVVLEQVEDGEALLARFGRGREGGVEVRGGDEVFLRHGCDVCVEWR